MISCGSGPARGLDAEAEQTSHRPASSQLRQEAWRDAWHGMSCTSPRFGGSRAAPPCSTCVAAVAARARALSVWGPFRWESTRSRGIAMPAGLGKTLSYRRMFWSQGSSEARWIN